MKECVKTKSHLFLVCENFLVPSLMSGSFTLMPLATNQEGSPQHTKDMKMSIQPESQR